MDFKLIQDQQQKENTGEKQKGNAHSFSADVKRQCVGDVGQFAEEKQEQLAQQNPYAETAGHCNEVGIKGFPAENAADMLLFHAEDVIKPDFFLPAFHQKTVDVQQQNDSENANDDCSKMQHPFLRRMFF